MERSPASGIGCPSLASLPTPTAAAAAAALLQVRSGQADAPGMDCALELSKLEARYKAWKTEFKTRLLSTQKGVGLYDLQLASMPVAVQGLP